MTSARRLLAIGDSITHGEGEAMLGIPCRPWAEWLALTLGLEIVNLAQDGATVPAMLDRQLPHVVATYEVAAIYAGVNDVRSLAFDLDAYRKGLDALFAGVAPHAGRLVTCTIPLDLGRPRAGAKVAETNAVIRATAARYSAAIAELDDLAGTTLVMPDAVHPWAAGQLEIADRAARALGLAITPSATVAVDRSPRRLARFALAHLGPAVLRDGRRRSVEAVHRLRNG